MIQSEVGSQPTSNSNIIVVDNGRTLVSNNNYAANVFNDF